MIKLLEEIDELLTYLEDTAHGEEGKRITEMRYKILTELSNSHKHGVMQAEGSDVSEGATVGNSAVGQSRSGGKRNRKKKLDNDFFKGWTNVIKKM